MARVCQTVSLRPQAIRSTTRPVLQSRSLKHITPGGTTVTKVADMKRSNS